MVTPNMWKTRARLTGQDKELALIVKTFYPDIRKVLNNVQACIREGKLSVEGKSFKYNVSFSGTYQLKGSVLNYQILTGAKILLSIQ